MRFRSWVQETKKDHERKPFWSPQNKGRCLWKEASVVVPAVQLVTPSRNVDAEANFQHILFFLNPLKIWDTSKSSVFWLLSSHFLQGLSEKPVLLPGSAPWGGFAIQMAGGTCKNQQTHVWKHGIFVNREVFVSWFQRAAGEKMWCWWGALRWFGKKL